MHIKAKVTIKDSKLKELKRKAEKLDGQREVPLPELMTDGFMRRYTDFQTLQAMFDASGLENLEDIDSEEFSKFIATHTRCSNWEEMLKMANVEYMKRQLGF